MPGVTKHIFEHDIRDILEMWSGQLRSIQKILPMYYKDKDIISLLKHFYPHEWSSVEIKYWYYQRKDKDLLNRFGKARYYMPKPEILLQSAYFYKTIMSQEYQKNYINNFSEVDVINAKVVLWNKRKPKIEKVDQKIEKAICKT